MIFSQRMCQFLNSRSYVSMTFSQRRAFSSSSLGLSSVSRSSLIARICHLNAFEPEPDAIRRVDQPSGNIKRGFFLVLEGRNLRSDLPRALLAHDPNLTHTRSFFGFASFHISSTL